MIDLRSDTVTRPTPAMRRAMADAPVGDDVYGEDPTVNALQERVAGMLGKEAALFVPSGTMGNLISILCHCPERGREVFVGDQSHVYWYEQAGASAVGSLAFHPIPTNPDGTLPLDVLRSAVRDPANPHYPPPGLLCLENTHNRCGGTVLTPGYCARARIVADSVGVPMHLDGARLANAAVALGLPLSRLAESFDSVQLDLSKGLGAPVGGVVAGPKGFIARALRARKLLGGGMRQAGVIAAAAGVALDLIPRLADDHALARRLAESLAGVSPHVIIDLATVQTNIVMLRLNPPWDAATLLAALKADGILAGAMGPDRVRFVTHYDVTADDVDAAIRATRRALSTAH